MLGAEVFGRSYGGGVLKMEPKEAARLPVPSPAALTAAYSVLRHDRSMLEKRLEAGRWEDVVTRVDEVLLNRTFGLSNEEIALLRAAAEALRERRMGRRIRSGA